MAGARRRTSSASGFLSRASGAQPRGATERRTIAVDAAEEGFRETIGAEREQATCRNAEQQAAMRLTPDRKQRAGKAARLVRVGVERREDEKDTDDRNDDGARQIAGTAERGH